MSKRTLFENLAVGSCYAHESSTRHATRRKIDARHTITLPDGRRTFRVEDIETPVYVRPCAVSFGRRRKRRKNKRSR
jgi:hypothetical protein